MPKRPGAAGFFDAEIVTEPIHFSVRDLDSGLGVESLLAGAQGRVGSAGRIAQRPQQRYHALVAAEMHAAPASVLQSSMLYAFACRACSFGL